MYRYRLWILNLVLVLAVLGSVWGRRIDSLPFTHPFFLKDLRLPFRGMTTSDESLDSNDLRVLEPDGWMVRNYQSADGDWAQLAVIAGHQKRSIHTPAFCMVGGDYETLTQEPAALQLPDGRQIPAARSLMEGHDTKHHRDFRVVVTYFFSDGDFCTPSLVRFQVAQFFARFGSTVPMGATVRIMALVRGNDDAAVRDANKLSDAFAQATVPGVLAALRQARLNPR